MIKQLHLYDTIHETKESVAVNFDTVQYFKPNNISSEFTDIYFSKDDHITVWESYDSLLKSF